MDDAQMLKVTFYFNDTDTLYVYMAQGNEAIKIATTDRIGGIRADTVGWGGTHFLTPSFGIAPRLEFQRRNGETTSLQWSLESKYRW